MKMLTPPEVAKLLRITSDKVLGWIRSGELRSMNVAAKTGGRPRYRVAEEDLTAFLARRAVVPPPPVRRRRKPADYSSLIVRRFSGPKE